MAYVLKFFTDDDGQVYPYYEEDTDTNLPNTPRTSNVPPTQTEVPDIVDVSGTEAAIPEHVPRTYEQAIAERADTRRAALAERRAQPNDDADAISRAIEPERQFIRGALNTAISAPWQLGGVLSDIATKAFDRDAQSDPEYQNPVSDFMLDHAVGTRENIKKLTGDKEPEHFLERAMGTMGEAAVPYGKNAAAISAIAGSVNTGMREVNRARELPGLDAFKNAPDWVASAMMPAAQAAPGPTVPDVGQPDAPIRNQQSNRFEKLFDKKGVPIQTSTGPYAITEGEYKTIGTMAAITMGMLFTPMVYRRIVSNRLPRFRSVANADPQTLAMSNHGDLARTYDDVNAGAKRLLRRAGIDVAAAERVENVLNLQTRSTANALVDSAINTGRMTTPSYTFQVRVPLAELAKRETPATRDYLHVLDTLDEIRANSIGGLSSRVRRRALNPTGGVVRGLDIVTATNLKNNLERANPGIQQYAQAYRENLRAMRRFEADGEYATLAPGLARQLNAQHKNTVPFKGTRSNDPNMDRGSPIEALANRMRSNMRDRLENEARGIYIDTMRQSTDPRVARTFVPVDTETLAENANWRRNTSTFKRRGENERYTTDPFLADVLRMDPYYITGGIGQAFYATKRIMETTTTGELAPWFAPTSFLRNWQIGKLTAENGMRSPTLAGSLYAIPQQLYPQLAGNIHRALDRGSAGWLNSVFGQGRMMALSTRLAHHYERSLYAQLESAGGGRGAILQQQLDANNRLSQAIDQAAGPFKALLEGYRATLQSIHNAPSFNYASRNQGRVPIPELARRARALTGDPRVGGEYYNKVPGDKSASPIRFESENRMSHIAGRAVQMYGWSTEVGRTAIPWYNATVQGVKRVGEAYLENPAKFTARTWLYQIAPAASFYLATKALGNDPNGLSYLDYAMNRRTENNKMMNFYIPIPGRPAAEGIEMPSFHEMSAARYLTEIALDHAYGNAIFTEKEDLLRAAEGVTGIIFEPAYPPLVNVALARFGMRVSGGVFSNDAYKGRQDPFEQRGGVPHGTELYTRAIAPGIADVVGQGYAAYSQTPAGFMKGLENAAKGTSDRAIQKTPILRDIVNIKMPMTGNNAITAELMAKRRSLRELEQHYTRWTKGKGLIGTRVISRTGEEIANEYLGTRPPSESAGRQQPPPTNPLYNQFIEDLHNWFVKDATVDKRGKDLGDAGGFGFPSLYARYSAATTQIERLKKVSPGNLAAWREDLDKNSPEQVKYLKEQKVDPYNPKAVQNFYETKRQDAARVLLHYIRETEKEMSEYLGRPVKIEDIRPYGKGLGDGEAEPDSITE